MSIFREIPPTAGWPLYIKDILSSGKDGGQGSLELDFKKYLNVEYTKVVNTATAALYLILESIKERSHKKTVIIPSLICPLVPLAVKKAALNVEVCDVTGSDFNYNLEALERLCAVSDDILAVIVAHIGGLPADLDPVRRICDRYGITMIEDCAIALGAKYKNKPVGTIGDFSMFSLGLGKGLSIFQGGVAVAKKKEDALPLDDTIGRSLKDDRIAESVKILQLLGYWIFYRPQLFWFVFRLPQVYWLMRGDVLKAYMDYFGPDIPVHRVSGMRKDVGHAGFYRIDTHICRQRRTAEYFINALEGTKGLKVVMESPGTQATYPYVTLIYDKPEGREKAWNALKDSGLGISTIYAFAITDFPYLCNVVPRRDPEAGRYMAKRALTLSTSAFLKEEELLYIADKVKEIEKG